MSRATVTDKRTNGRANGAARTSRAASASSATGQELRIAAIDVGSNSIHIIVAQVDASGGLSVLWRDKEMVGLGRISFPSHRLSTEAMERALIALRRFVSEAQRWQCEEVVAVATSAVREAENGGEFIERVRRELRVHIRVVSARDEARLIYLGVKHARDLVHGPHLIIDLGGGSVEFIVSDDDRPLLLESRKLGAARMTAKFVKSDPIEAKDVKALLAHYDQELSPIFKEIARLKPRRIIGTSGAIENLAAMGAGSASSEQPVPVLKRDDLERIVGQLIESTSESRASMKGLDDKRRDQITAAAILVQDLFRRLEVDEIRVCESALREGILIDYLTRHRPELEIRREAANPRRRAVLDLGRRCHWHRDHGEQVARLCVRLFDQLRPLHGMDKRERELIEYGALLHDIGSLIERRKHHKHSMYLILNGDLQPFSQKEIRTIANIARYHRKAFPNKAHKEFASLPKRYRQAVKFGAALLRIADGLDRTNCAVVEDVICRIRPDRVDMLVRSRGDDELELWSAYSRSKLFEKVFDRKLVLRNLA